jgi:hypothetical protein
MFCRRIQGETARKPLFKYQSPGELENVISKQFQYRRDPLDGNLDYTSHPEYVQAVLDDPKLKDGDCDDGHWYIANCLKAIKDVTAVYFLSSGWDGPAGAGGHCTAVYKYNGAWYHFDWTIHPINDPNEAPNMVTARYGGTKAFTTFWVWESVGETGDDTSAWKPLAICPDPLVK